MTIDPTKTYRTKNGHPVRIYTADAGGFQPVHGAIQDSSGIWLAKTWTADGRNGVTTENGLDLIEQKPRFRREGWVNVYPTWIGRVYEDREEADKASCERRAACLKITIEGHEGEGLDNE